MSQTMTNTGQPDQPKVVIAIVRDHQGRFLLVNRKEDGGRLSWIFPGGKQEAGEGDMQTAQREVLEETGVKCHARYKLGERIHPVSGKSITYVFCNYLSGKARVTEPEIMADVTWMSPTEVFSHLQSGIFQPVEKLLRASASPRM